jgi:hypothetical protein
MATITVTELLGGDNIAGSRITINNNFKTIVSAINSQGQYLDTSATPGAALTVGTALVKKYSRAISSQIFNCEATGNFGGNLNVGQDLGVTRDLTVLGSTTLHGNLNLDGSAGGTIVSTIPFSQDAGIVNPQLYNGGSANALLIDPQTLTGTGPVRSIPTTSSFKKVNTIRLNFSTFDTEANNCDTVTLPSVTDTNVAHGQIITLLIDSGSADGVAATFGINTSNWYGGYTQALFNGTDTNAYNAILLQSAITVFADSNGWRVLHVFGSDSSVY